MRSTLANPLVADPASVEVELVDLAYQFIMGAAYISLGYFSGGIRRSIVALTLFFAGTLVVELLPVRGFGPDYFEQQRQTGALLEALINTLVLATIVGVGAHIDKRARVRQKLREHDPAFVVAEIIEIQWRLNPIAGSSCVIVVDVAGSTRMKADADPLAVEYSFRAFHEFVANVGDRRGGTVVSTAGDAAVLTFQSCPEALYAAKEVQTELERFNAHVNRLENPFRVRIGIHTGNVSAQLSDVPFNEVIDIAAHVEKEAPVGGIAITQPVADVIKDERVAELKELVDGQQVFVVLNPTLVA
jgi:class 3 adenylate cyclase